METKEIKVKDAEVITPTAKKKQKISVSYTLKSFGENIKKLENEKIISKEDAEKIKEIHKKAVEHWIGLEFNM